MHGGNLVWPEWRFFHQGAKRKITKDCVGKAEEMRARWCHITPTDTFSSVLWMFLFFRSQESVSQQNPRGFPLNKVVAPQTDQNTNYKQDKRAH